MPLSDLPTEVITEVIAWLPTTRSVNSLSQTNRHLHHVVDKEGWKEFQLQRFPSIKVTGDWKNAVRHLTALSRNWDRKAVLARFHAPITVSNLNENKLVTWQKPRGQTMGYQPQLDSTLGASGGHWPPDREVLATSAGAEILFRTRTHMTESSDQWFRYRAPDAREGADDVTSLKLLNYAYNARQVESAFTDSAIYGTARGDIGLLHVNLDADAADALTRLQRRAFQNDPSSVQQLSTAPSNQTMVAALADGGLALYPIPDISDDSNSIAQLDRLYIAPDQQQTRIWTVSHVSETIVAVGLGPSKTPLRIYDVRPTGLSQEPSRTFALTQYSAARRHTVSASSLQAGFTTSISQIIPLPDGSSAGNASGNLFLSGCYDGAVRLHDLRSPADHELSFFDATSQAAVYSIATLARERLVAGYSTHNLFKFFDLRISGGRRYSYNQRNDTGNDLGWNLFINAKETLAWQGSTPGQPRPRRRFESPVYSLSVPAPTSPYLYAGLEDNVVQFHWASRSDYESAGRDFSAEILKDRYPPTYRTQRNRRFHSSNYMYDPNIVNMAIYDHIGTQDGDIHMKHLSLSALDAPHKGSVPGGLDERWIDK